MAKMILYMLEDLKISIITPVLNNITYIEDAIQSVLKQDYTNYEHIIVDGESTDGTLEILKKYKHLKWISQLLWQPIIALLLSIVF